MRILLLILASVAASAACIEIESGRISSNQLGHLPKIPETADLGLAPAPGVVRVFSPGELRRRTGVEMDKPVCVTYKTVPLNPEAVRSALRKAVGIADTEVELVDYSRAEAPQGELVFPASGVVTGASPGPDTILFWRGYVRYGNRRSFAVWAKAKLRVTRPEVRVRSAIAAGSQIQAVQLTVEQAVQCAVGKRPLADAVQAVGRIALRSMQPGQPVWKEWLREKLAVTRGEKVIVRVTAGTAAITTSGRAESSGAFGQLVVVRNPSSGKTFRAVVEGIGRVWVKGS